MISHKVWISGQLETRSMHLVWLTSGNDGIQFTNIANDHEARNVEQADTGTQPDEQAPHVLHMVNWAVILVGEVSIMAADEVVAMDEVMHVAPSFVSGVVNQVTMHLNVMQLQKKYKSTGTAIRIYRSGIHQTIVEFWYP